MGRFTQRDKLLRLLSNNVNHWVGLPEILQLGIAQYNARIKELRTEGWYIENTIKVESGERHSWYRLIDPEYPAEKS